MLPRVRPFTVRQGVAERIARYGNAVVSCQQITPSRIAVRVRNRIGRRAKLTRSVSVFILRLNIAARVVRPRPRLARNRVVLADKLIRRVVNVACRVRAVADRGYVAVVSKRLHLSEGVVPSGKVFSEVTCPKLLCADKHYVFAEKRR